MTDPTATVLDGLDATLEGARALYRDLHEHPELSGEETRTAALIADRLNALGYEVQHIGGGVVGVLSNGQGPSVLTRADIDALPVQEDTGLEYSSREDGVMHACGHDVHITCALAAATQIAQHPRAWAGTYIALFQPAEETAAGARAMVEDGLTAKVPTPDVCLAQHVGAIPAGIVATHAGPTMSAGDSIRVTIHGQGSHGSMPHMGVDPVVTAAAIVGRLQTVVSRTVEPGVFAVVTVGSFQAGTKANVIPGSATLLVNVRTYDEDVRTRVLAAIERIVRAECEAAACPREPDLEYYDRFPLTVNDEEATARVTAAFSTRFGAEHVMDSGRMTASEDFSRIPEAFGAPSTYWVLGGYPQGAEPHPNHSPHFAPVIDPTLATGTEALVTGAMDWLGRRTA